jgi:hypothetical protein
MPITLEVADLVVTTREVEVPDICPECGAAFREIGFIHWEYQDQKRGAPVAEDGTIDWAEGFTPKAGESFIPVLWQCGGCGHDLAEGKSHVE